MEEKILTNADILPFFPARDRNSHKGTYGTAQLIVGSERYVGAAVLCAEACLRSGCGYTKLLSTDKVKFALAPHIPQVIFNKEPDLSANAVAIGSGSGVGYGLYSTLKMLLKEYSGTLIIDADGLNVLAEFGINILKDSKCKVVLTPHIKEFSRLCGCETDKILTAPSEYAKEFAKNFGAVVVLKNYYSVITDGERTVINTTGTTALAKAGSGDMLAGFMCGTAARGVPAFEAAYVSAYIMGRSAEITSWHTTDYCATSEEILSNIPNAIKDLTA